MSRIRPARLALPWVLGLAMACTEQSEPPAAPPSAPAAAPAAAEQRARPATIETTTTTTTITPPARQCEGEGLARFPCDHGTLCASVDALDDTVTLTELLCVVRSARSPDDTLRIGDILRDLPARFRLNFTLKHGTKGSGLRGHPQELMADVVGDALAKRSQSADLDFPRVIMWDQATGTTISFNGGLTASGADTRTQTGADRLDLMGWDSKAHRFELWGLDIPVGHEGGDSAWAVAPYQPHEPDDDCLRCHGPRSRPIWPMYPDWPGFYGSDNDELTGDSTHQTTEREFLGYFRHCVAAGPVVPQVGDQPAVDCAKVRGAAAALPDGATPGPADLVDTRRRYDTLFAAGLDEELGARFRRADRDAVRTYITGLDERLRPSTVAKIRTPQGLAAARGTEEQLRTWLGLQRHDTWPYRPNRAEQSTEPSRAFFHRPNLRLGLLYNRLNALVVFDALRAHPLYERFDRLLVLSLMDCGFGANPDLQRAVVDALGLAASVQLTAAGLSLHDAKRPGHRISVPALLAAFGLRVRDVDIRYSYPNRRFDRFDRDYPAPVDVRNPMALGYMSYERKDFNAVNGSAHYWNSYFDGSATTDELLVALVLADLSTRHPVYAALFTAHTLDAKYSRFVSRQVLDAQFFEQMDALSGWVPLPYPSRLEPIHHRQSFHRKEQGRLVFREQYAAVCEQLRTDLSEAHRPAAAPGGRP